MDNRVLIDSDFCNMIAPGNNVQKDKEFVKSIFTALGRKPCLHTFVFNEEILTNVAIKELVKENFIEVIEYSSVLKEPWMETLYINTFVDYYEYMNSEKIPNTMDSIKQHRAKKNMGEIHSLLFAQYLNIPIFMSNDNGARNLAISKINTQSSTIIVKNVLEVFCDCKKNTSSPLNQKAVKSILKSAPIKTWLTEYQNQK